MAKKKLKGPNFVLVPQARMSEEEKDQMFFHLLRRRQLFEEGLACLSIEILVEEADEKYLLLFRACRNLAKKTTARPGGKEFRGLLKDEVHKIGQEQIATEEVVEAARELADEGGFIDEAFAVKKADLSNELGRTLLRRFLLEANVVQPLEELLLGCNRNGQVPENLPEVLELALERVRKLEGIQTKSVKTFEEEWEDHEVRLKYYRGKKLIGLKTGLAELDRRTLGLRGLFILGARPGAGKTTLACVAIAIGVCQSHAGNDCVVIVVCLDMDRFDLYRRIHCSLGDIEWVTLMFGSPEQDREPGSMFSAADQERLKVAKRRLKDEQIGRRLKIPDRTVLGEDITAHRLSALIREHKARVGAKRALVIIDYLQLIPVPEEVVARGDLAADKHRVRLVQQVIERSRTTDDPLGDTALVISEARKPPTAREKDHWGDSMSELMGSARLGYAGDAVLLYREMTTKEMGTYYGVMDKEAADKRRRALREQGITPVMLILEKGRDGMIRGAWGAEFFFNKSQFRELQPNKHLLASAPPSADGDKDSDDTDEGAVSNSNGHVPLPPPSNGFTGKAKKKSKKAASKNKAASKSSTKHPK
jgi:replicative DNA helicase